ncbi:hypothetical protein COCNU_scaffold004501G000010 [Cocos nucifera]|nr:hypothetical protein [Cocos nucifera]
MTRRRRGLLLRRWSERLIQAGRATAMANDLGIDPFSNPEIIQDLIDKFALPRELGHHILAHLKRISCQEAEASKVQGDLQAKVDILHGKVAEAECLMEEKAAKNEDLQGTLRREEVILTELKAALILEEEKKKEVEIKVVELEAQISKFALEVVAQAIEEFKASSGMKDLNVTFG